MNKLLLFFVAQLYFIESYAQQWLWVNTISNHSSIERVLVDSTGNAYLIGAALDSSLAFNGTSSGVISTNNLNTFVAKYTDQGAINWVSGGSKFTYNKNTSIDNFGNIYLTGEYYNSAYFGITTNTIQNTAIRSGDGYLVKLNSSGQAVYFKTEGDTCSDNGQMVSVLRSGKLLHIGQNLTTCYDDNYTPNQFLRVQDANTGSLTWSVVANAWTLNQQSFARPTRDNGFILCGSYGGNTQFNGVGDSLSLSSFPNAYDTYLIKYKDNGEIDWGQSIGGPDYDFPQGLAVDANNNILLGIRTLGPVTFQSISLSTNTLTMLHVIKLDSNGNYLNHISFNAEEYMGFWLSDIQTDKQGNIYLCATVNKSLIIGTDTVFYKDPNTFGSAIAIMKFDAQFNYIWSQTATGSCNCGGKIAVTDDIIYFGMHHDGNIGLSGTNYTFTANPSWQAQSFIAGIANSRGTTASIKENTSLKFDLHPNPTQGNIILNSLDFGDIVSVNVSDCCGRCVYKNSHKRITSIDLTGLDAGVYLIEVKSKEKRGLKKIIIE